MYLCIYIYDYKEESVTIVLKKISIQYVTNTNPSSNTNPGSTTNPSSNTTLALALTQALTQILALKLALALTSFSLNSYPGLNPSIFKKIATQ
jgi:hypothetical protein